ncbi:MAG TPA: magnesium transporter [Actinomycetota bacterium]|nr:magnesium transporter [Actinomycetota bacterium]
MAFAPRRRARSIWRFYRAEQRTLRQGLAALLLSTGAGLVAGIVLGSISDTLTLLPSLFILIPAAVGMKGTIFGAIGARLGTASATGLFEVTRERSGVLYQNVYAGTITTFSSCLYLAALARLSAAVFGLHSISFLDFVTISVVGGVLGSAFAMALTIGLSVASFRRGFDLDSVSTPIVTASGDMVTIPCLFLATFIVRVEWLNAVVAGICIVVCLYAIVRGAMTDLKLARRAILEMTGVIVLTPLLDILAGTIVEPRIERFAAFPALLVIIPPLVSNAGALGGILSSRLSSKLHLGLISTRMWPERLAWADASLVMASGLVAFTLVGTLGYLYGVVVHRSLGPGVMIGGTVLTGVITTFIAIFVGYYVAVLATRFGLDPDNQSVPIITSVMDLAGVITFLLVLSVLGVGIR